MKEYLDVARETCLCLCLCVFICLCVCMCVSVCVCVYGEVCCVCVFKNRTVYASFFIVFAPTTIQEGITCIFTRMGLMGVKLAGTVILSVSDRFRSAAQCSVIHNMYIHTCLSHIHILSVHNSLRLISASLLAFVRRMEVRRLIF